LKFKLKGLKPSSSSGFKDWYEKQKAKQAAQRALVPTMLRILTFATTLASMMLGLSLLALFPQPLPIVIAFLIAFIAYENPAFSLPVGGVLIGLGLIYNMSKVNFISVLGDQFVREAVIFVFLFVLVVLPIVFRRHKAAIAINLGIIAAILLFFSQAYFLAIPLIFASIMIFKKQSFLTVVYYGLISTPLYMMQYLSYIKEAAQIQTDWWVIPGSSPPIFVPLTQIFKTMQDTMVQFRLFDTSQIVYAITAQVTQTPPPEEHTIIEVFSHYLDSVPGIVLFLVIVAVLVTAFVLLMRVLMRQAHVDHGERLLPPITAAVGTLVFFVFLTALQGPLAFEAQIDGGKVAIGTLAAVFFALPALFIDQTPKRKATVEMMAQKAQELLKKLQNFECTLTKVQENLPADVSAIEGKMLILKDRLTDTLSKTSKGVYEPSEIDDAFNDLEAASKEVDNLTAELDVSLKAYQMLVEGEYSTWIGRFRDIGLEAKAIERKDFQHELPIEERITRIKETMDAGVVLVTDVAKVAEQAYNIVRSLYDPNLPEESQAIVFAKKQLEEKTDPWIASAALFTALNNWKKQYSAEIARSVEYLQNAITIVAGLSAQSERLRQVLGDDFSKIMDVAKRAEDLKMGVEKNAITVANVMIIREVLESSLGIVKDALLILSEELNRKEESIDSLLPTEDYLWEKNTALKEGMTSVTDVFLNPSKYGLNQALANMPQAVSYLNECVSTIARYKEQEELLLNYPVAETAIEDSFKQKPFISVHDLPFEPKFAEEYLKLFYSKRFRDYSFDDQKVTLKRNVG
jgi:hypothetical protein